MATTSGKGLGFSKYHSVPKFKYPNHHIEETEDIWHTSNDVPAKKEIDKPFLLMVDSAITIQGRGAVATGTVE